VGGAAETLSSPRAIQADAEAAEKAKRRAEVEKEAAEQARVEGSIRRLRSAPNERARTSAITTPSTFIK
jgi:hypothetical protein